MNIEIKQAILRVIPFVIILIVLFLAIKKGKINRDEINLKKPIDWSKLFICSLGFLLFVLATEIIFYKFGLLTLEPWKHAFLPSLIRIVGAVICAPMAEEIIFRGLLLSKLHSKLNNMHLAIFLQAVLFVLLHNFAYENTVSSNIGIVQSFIDASLFAYAKYYTKSLYTPILMHMSGNFVAVFERML
jgi:membrane protease YdiL (CAAX protease family)